MARERSLDPETRTLYCEALRPPLEYSFDSAIATTFTLDFETALSAPVSLALYAAESGDELLKDPLLLLEGAERIAGRVAIFVNAGRIQASTSPKSRLCALLEQMIVEVIAPNGGAFHPKMWAIRFRPNNPKQPIRTRLLILSRNLTRDRSWDAALTLDGEVAGGPQRLNRPLYDFMMELQKLAGLVNGMSENLKLLTTSIAEDIRKTKWEVPEPFEAISFSTTGINGKPWKFETCSKLGVISPFCDNDALKGFAESATDKEKPILIGRADELAALSEYTIARFSQISVLDEAANSEDGEEQSEECLSGLHAKVFVSELGRDTTIVVGSGNATRPALITGKNVEIFAALTGKRSKVGSVEEILGKNGFGRLTRPFIVGEVAKADADLKVIERRLDDARMALCKGGLALQCSQSSADGAQWQLKLNPSAALPLKELSKLEIWPITRGETHAKAALDSLRCKEAIGLGEMPIADLTRFIACRVVDASGRLEKIFSMGLPIQSLPDGRHAAILRSIIDTRSKFLQYLRLLLAGDDEIATGVGQRSTAGTLGSANGEAESSFVFEEMVRALCDSNERFPAIDNLMTKLVAQGGVDDPIPPEFRSIWSAFRTVARGEDPKDA